MHELRTKEDILRNLNPEQKEAVVTFGVPVLALSAAGSGKTSVLTRKICYLNKIEGLLIERILAITFTNKASKEMQDRIKKYLGISGNLNWISTFHSLSIKIIKNNMSKVGYNENFTIYDASESKSVIKNITESYIHDNGLSEIVYNEDSVKSMISRIKLSSDYKEGLLNLKKSYISQDIMNKEVFFSHIENLFELYQNNLKENNALDFDDMLVYAVRVLKENSEVREHWQNKFDYILVDEYQDTNGIQYELLKLIVGERNKNNIMVVGDVFQCQYLQYLNTPEGLKHIDDVVIGDKTTTLKKNKIIFSEINKINKSIAEKTLKIKTKLGKEIITTYSHRFFVTNPAFNDEYYLYLMYRQDKGFRLGVTRGGLKDKKVYTRLARESGERIWFLYRFNGSIDSSYVYYLENYFSLKYQIPTNPFRTTGRSLRVSEEYNVKLFNDFGLNGQNLLDDLGLDFNYPNHITQNKNSRSYNNHKNIIITLNHEKNTYVGLEYDFKRIRKVFSNYKEAYAYAKCLEIEHGASIVERYKYKGNINLNTVLANQLLISMKTPVLHDGNIVLDEIVSIEQINEPTEVYDLEIPETGLILANDFVTHNCIYEWRGARAENILGFDKDFENTKTIKLGSNYRSTPNILNYANKVMNLTKVSWKDKLVTLLPTKSEGNDVRVNSYTTDETEAQMITNQIQLLTRSGKVQFQNIAILLRMSFISRVIEDSFIRNRIPYQVIGGLTFYERAEIKILLSYLKFAMNTNDRVSLDKIINVPSRTIGKQALDTIKNHYVLNTSWLDAIQTTINSKLFRGDTSKKAIEFVSLINSIKDIVLDKPKTALDTIINSIDFYTYLQYKYPENYDDRISNVQELLNILQKIEESVDKENPKNFNDFLIECVTRSDQDDLENNTNKVKIMTIHASKGLEFPVVFIPALEEGILPSKRSVTFDQLEEELRLLYVAITRAEKLCFISYSGLRGYDRSGQKNKKIPSRYII